MEGAWFLAGHNLTSLSEEQLIHCSGQNCGGGNPGHAISYVISNHGINAEANYRYSPHNGACDPLKAGHHVAAFSGSGNVPQRNEAQLMAAVKRQPVAVAIGVTAAFRNYHRGVMGGSGAYDSTRRILSPRAERLSDLAGSFAFVTDIALRLICVVCHRPDRDRPFGVDCRVWQLGCQPHRATASSKNRVQRDRRRAAAAGAQSALLRF